MARRLDPSRCRVKVGMELFTAAGPAILEDLHRLGFQVFLDLKFHDIPNTVAGACRRAAAHGVWMLNVHACGGRRMLEGARDAARDGDHRPLVIAVTVPTSMEESDLVETQRTLDFQSSDLVPAGTRGSDLVEARIANALSERVRSLERLSRECGLDGIVCSAADLEILPKAGEPGFIRVTPGDPVRERCRRSAPGHDARRRGPRRGGLSGHRPADHPGAGSDRRARGDRARHRSLRRLIGWRRVRATPPARAPGIDAGGCTAPAVRPVEPSGRPR